MNTNQDNSGGRLFCLSVFYELKFDDKYSKAPPPALGQLTQPQKDVLAFYHNPNFKRPMDNFWPSLSAVVADKRILRSIGFSGAVGVGKTTLMNKIITRLSDRLSMPVHQRYTKSGISYITSDKICYIFLPDFSVYIDKYLDDIDPRTSCLHASVFYRSLFEDMENLISGFSNSWNYVIYWDRSPIENIVFGTLVNDDYKGLLGPEFWHSISFMKIFKAFMPSVVHVFMIDEKLRRERVLGRCRRQFELDCVNGSLDQITKVTNSFLETLFSVYTEANVKTQFWYNVTVGDDNLKDFELQNNIMFS